MCQVAIYPGTFDPVTYGHLDIIKRAQEIFSEVIIAVAHNPHKQPLFSVKERTAMLKKATAGLRAPASAILTAWLLILPASRRPKF